MKKNLIQLTVCLLVFFLPCLLLAKSYDIKKIDTVVKNFFNEKSEKNINKVIINATKGKYKGVNSFIKGKKILEMSFDDISNSALESNLQLKVSDLNKKITDETITEIDASFDPVMNLNLNFSHTDYEGRSQQIYRERFKDGDSENEGGGGIGQITIDGTALDMEAIYDEILETEIQNEAASSSSHSSWYPGAWSGGLTISKYFSWGQNISLGLTSYFAEQQYPSNIGNWSALCYNYQEYPFGNNPWISSLSLNFSSPIPFLKNFGKYGDITNVRKIAVSIDKEIAMLSEKSDINNVLRDASFSYWNLVRNVKRLQIIIEHRKTLEKRAKDSSQLLKTGDTTIYDNAQIQADLENTKSKEQIIWIELIKSSNQIIDILGYEDDLIILPIKYSNLLFKKFVINEEKDIAIALKKRPNLLMAEKVLQKTNTWYKYRSNQVMPDIRLSFNGSLSQASTYYGYETWADSVGNIFNPDSSYFFVGLVYNWPTLNKYAKAAKNKTKIQQKQNMQYIDYTKNEVIKEMNQTIANAYSLENQKKIAKKYLFLKQQDYNEALEMFSGNDINEFELLTKYQELLNAKYSYLDSVINYKTAYIQLLWAEGILYEK